MMEDALHSFRAVLEKQKAVYGELLMLAEQQREALITRQVETLMEIAAKQGRLIAQAGKIERKGKEAIGHLAAELEIEGQEPTVTAVLERLDAKQAEPLKALRDQIVQAAARLAYTNQINAELFQAALDWIRFTIRLIAESRQAPEPCYPIGDSSRQLASVMVDQRV